ncbi:hypothetical protein BKI52_41930 [marine bacterium AO1-C]|nr:hypothetical protein BKI52_41930 [marine bacterium AO1-C]
MNKLSTKIIVMSPDELTILIEEAVEKALLDCGIKKEEDLMKIDELCEWLRVSKATVNNWKSEGLIPFYRLGSRIYFKKSEVIDAAVSSRYLKD